MESRKLRTDDYSRIELCVGIDQGDRHCDELTIDRMRGVDEERLAEKRARNNMALGMTMLFQRTILAAPPIWEDVKRPLMEAPLKLVQSMSQGDRDLLLLHLRCLSFGETMDVPGECSKCGEKFVIEDFDLGTIDVKVWPKGQPQSIPFTLEDGFINRNGELCMTGSLRLITGYDQEMVIKQTGDNSSKAATAILYASIAELGSATPTLPELASNMTTRDRLLLGRIISESMPGPRMVTDYQCPDCGESQEISISFVNFLKAS